MAYIYVDESIREVGDFIIGAIVVSSKDLTPILSEAWLDIGLDPEKDEYKSSALKANNEQSKAQRSLISELLNTCELALTVLPASKRKRLGSYCADLLMQLRSTGQMRFKKYHCYFDEHIKLNKSEIERLSAIGVEPYLNSDSKKVSGIQVADHAAHALGGMLLEEMGLVKKLVRPGESLGYHPEEDFELGFELWASLRNALIGNNEYIEGLSPEPEDPANPYFRVEGYGLYIAPSCDEELTKHARSRFGINYLGCIH